MKTTIAFLFVATTLPIAGCDLLIEKRTQVIVIPPESKEIHIYYEFEGISMREDGLASDLSNGRRSQLSQAKADLDGLQMDGANFFSSGEYSAAPRANMRVEKLRFFKDPTRERSLCADRRITILDRSLWEKEQNNETSSLIKSILENNGNEGFRESIRVLREE
jgi:hypothetical protein